MGLNKLIPSLALIAIANAIPPERRDIDNTQPAGTNPINGFDVKFLGNQVADNSCTHRDLGFAGKIKDKWYAIYGDNLWCAPGVTDPTKDPSGFHGMVRDSVSALGSNPLIVHDLNLNNDSPVKHPNQFVPFNPNWGETNTVGFGGTSLVETDYNSATAALYYLIVSSCSSTPSLYKTKANEFRIEQKRRLQPCWHRQGTSHKWHTKSCSAPREPGMVVGHWEDGQVWRCRCLP